MKKINVFDKKYNIILNPFALESLWHLVSHFKDLFQDIEFNELKKITIYTLKFLLRKDLIYILTPNYMEHKEFNKINTSNNEIIKKIKNIWTETLSDDELYSLAWFKFKDWYITGMSDKGLTVYDTDWNKFLEDKIGDLEQWIEENRPTD